VLTESAQMEIGSQAPAFEVRTSHVNHLLHIVSIQWWVAADLAHM
jgi:hypothetical protein